MTSCTADKLPHEPGDLVEVRAGYVILMPEPRDYGKHLRGLHREIWQDVEPEECVRQERDA